MPGVGDQGCSVEIPEGYFNIVISNAFIRRYYGRVRNLKRYDGNIRQKKDSYIEGEEGAKQPSILSCLFFLQEIVWRNTCFFKDCSKRPSRHITRMVLYGGISVFNFIIPDLVAAGSLAIKSESKSLKAFNNFTIMKTRQPSHVMHPR